MRDLDKVYAENIAKDYFPKKDRKVVALKRLDKKAKQPAYLFGYIFGSMMSLVLGIGMYLAMQIIAEGTISMVLGIVVGLLGIAGMAINPILFKKILEKRKKEYAIDILMLSEEIINE